MTSILCLFLMSPNVLANPPETPTIETPQTASPATDNRSPANAPLIEQSEPPVSVEEGTTPSPGAAVNTDRLENTNDEETRVAAEDSIILVKAGYSWDTGAHLSGNIDCRIVTAYDDHTLAHNCDTTRGDSGSPLMARFGDQYIAVATDSNFRSNPDGPMLYIAAQSSAWAEYVAELAAGRIGESTTRPTIEGKPDKSVEKIQRTGNNLTASVIAGELKR